MGKVNDDNDAKSVDIEVGLYLARGEMINRECDKNVYEYLTKGEINPEPTFYKVLSDQLGVSEDCIGKHVQSIEMAVYRPTGVSCIECDGGTRKPKLIDRIRLLLGKLFNQSKIIEITIK